MEEIRNKLENDKCTFQPDIKDTRGMYSNTNS